METRLLRQPGHTGPQGGVNQLLPEVLSWDNGTWFFWIINAIVLDETHCQLI
jgi:hypothetical protein